MLCFLAFFCMCLKELSANFDSFFWGVGCANSNSWLDFGDVPDRDKDTWIFKRNFYHCGIGEILRILQTTRVVVGEFYWNFSEAGCPLSKKLFDFGVNSAHDPNPGFLAEFLLLRDRGMAVVTSCARGDTICLRPLQVDNIFVFIRQVAPVPACWLFKTSAIRWPLTFWPWKWCPSHVWRALPLCQF